jgi:transposase
MLSLSLTTDQRRTLQQQLNAAPEGSPARLRTQAILEIADGKPVTRVARDLGVSRQSIYHWFAAFVQSHDPRALLDGDRNPGGRPSLFTPATVELLHQLLSTPPGDHGYGDVYWPVHLLRTALAAKGYAFSLKTIRRQLHELGYERKGIHYVRPTEPEPQWIAKEREETLALMKLLRPVPNFRSRRRRYLPTPS